MAKFERRLFGFRGRMKRSSFIAYHIGLAAIAASATITGALALRVLAETSGLGPDDPLFRAFGLWGLSLIGALTLWSLCAMAVKRARAAGLPKKPVALSIAGVPLIDHYLIAPGTPERLVWPFDALTPLALLVLAGVYLFLLTVPSQPIPPLGAREEDAGPSALPA